MSTDLTQKTFLTDSLSYLDEVEYCLRLKARWGRPTQLWPQSDSWRTPNGLERPLCAKEFHHPILWHKREKQKSWILMNDKAIAYKSSLVAKIKVVIKRGKRIGHVGLPLLIYSLIIMFSYFHIQTQYGLKVRRQIFRTKMTSIKLSSEQEFFELYSNVKSICERYIYKWKRVY